MSAKPTVKPKNPCFSSGPCAKRPGWDAANLDLSILGRSHRSGLSKKMLREIIDRTRKVLNIPADYKIGITAASGTGAVEMAMWNLLGAPGIGVDVFAWEQFSLQWLQDIVNELRLPGARAIQAPYGQLPDLSVMQPDRDAVFVWNGTTSGACIPNADMVPAGDKGLRICDATSAAIAFDLPWEKLDVTLFPWQKVLGGEAQHGMIVMSPKALARVANYRPAWPIPKIFQLRLDDGQVDEDFFEGITLNTPSMLCVADALDGLKWVESIGGAPAIRKRVAENAAVLDAWVQKTPWIDYLVADPVIRSKASVCLQFVAPEFIRLEKPKQIKVIDTIVGLLEQEQAAYDIKSYKTAPAGLRVWCGNTVETDAVRALTPWIDWAYAEAMQAA